VSDSTGLTASREFRVTINLPRLDYNVLTDSNPAAVSPGGTIRISTVVVGEASTITVTVTNLNGAPFRLTTVSVSGDGFDLPNLPALPITLSTTQPGVQFAFAIAFRPRAPGINNGALNIEGQTFNLTGIGLVGGISIIGAGSLTPRGQSALAVSLTNSYPVSLVGKLSVTFAPDVGAALDDPMVQFAVGDREANFVVPANSTQALFGAATSIGLQAGTTAGTITLRVQVSAAGTDVTPSPSPTISIQIPRLPPVTVRMSVQNRSPSGFQILIVGFATTRELAEATFRFSPAAQGSLPTTEFTIPLRAAAAAWYASPAAAPFGGQFAYGQPFTAQGDLSAVGSVSVTLKNGVGDSQPASVSLQ